jgi:hypothetical protein
MGHGRARNPTNNIPRPGPNQETEMCESKNSLNYLAVFARSPDTRFCLRRYHRAKH